MTYITLRVVIYTHRVTVMYLYTSSSISAVSQVGKHFYLIILMYLKSISVLKKLYFNRMGVHFIKNIAWEKSDYLFGTDLDIIMGGGGGGFNGHLNLLVRSGPLLALFVLYKCYDSSIIVYSSLLFLLLLCNLVCFYVIC